MSTEVYGHGLVREGALVLQEDGTSRRACACGELAPVDATGRGARRWHVAHKRAILIGRGDELVRVVEVAMIDLRRISAQLERLRRV